MIMKFKNVLCNLIFAAKLFQTVIAHDFPPATETYQTLNNDPENSFVVSFGTAMSQTHTTDNTCHPEFNESSSEQAPRYLTRF